MKLPEGTPVPFVEAFESAVVGTELVLLQQIPTDVNAYASPPVSETFPPAVAQAIVEFEPGDVTFAFVDTVGNDWSVVKLT